MSKNKDYIKNIEGAERRYFTGAVTIEKRADGEEEKPAVIEGYAALFNSPTEIGSWFREEILPGAFDDVLKDDVRCLFNHNPNNVLARSQDGKGTLTLSVDSKGLKYSYETPNRTYARDLADAIESGDVSQSSFGFTVAESVWIENDDEETDLRQIKKVKQLYDVSPVTYPAYQDTSVAKRSHDAFVLENTDVVIEEVRGDKKESLSVFEARNIINKSNS